MKTIQFFMAATAIMSLSLNAYAQSDGCVEITDVPYTISVPGKYCFVKDIVSSMPSGTAITIAADNVVLDLRGYTLRGAVLDSGKLSRGVYSTQRNKIAIRNGSIRGFHFGVWLNDNAPYKKSDGHLIEGIHFDGNASISAWIIGDNSIIRHTRITRMGNGAGGEVYGILASGQGLRIIDNDISEISAQEGASARAIQVQKAAGGIVSQNRMTGNQQVTNSAGLYITESENMIVRDNAIILFDFGIYFSETASGKYTNNVTAGIAKQAYTGGMALGGNF